MTDTSTDSAVRATRQKVVGTLLSRMLRGDAGHAETIVLIDELYQPTLVADAATEQIADTARTDLEALRAEDTHEAPAPEKVAARPRATRKAATAGEKYPNG